MSHKPWAEGEKRLNKFCFIGKDLKKDEMIEELKKCISDGKPPEPGPVPTDQLTYAVGDRVLANCGDWEEGAIHKLWYREEYWETGRYAPYQVMLDSGDLCYVPRDSSTFIKPAGKKAKTE